MITRRSLLASSVAAGATLSIPAIRRVQAADRPLTICTWGGRPAEIMKAVFFEPFAKQRGVEILETSPINYAKILAMVQAKAVEWDVLSIGGAFAEESPEALEPIDYSIVKADGVAKDWLKERSVHFFSGGTVIAYNTDLFPEGRQPRSWRDFWNVKDFPGPRALYSSLEHNYEAALLADGLSPSEIYPATDEKVQRAFAKLKELRPHVLVWWKSGAQPAQLLSTGEVAMSSAWSGRIADGKSQNIPIDMTWKEALIWADSLNVTKGTPYKDVAMELINYVISEKAQDTLSEYKIYAPVNQASIAKATDEQKKYWSTAHLEDGFIIDYKQTAWFLNTYKEQWQQFLIE